MSEPSTSRARARIQTTGRILAVGREHLATYGAAALSLRAVARDLDMVSSAVYRYVASRDDLLTMLVVDAYTDLADHVDAAHATAPDNNPGDQLRRCCAAFHDWAVSEPARYALLYGSPVPGYQAPAEQTSEPGTRVVALLLRTLGAAADAGHLARDAGVSGTSSGESSTTVDFDTIRSEFGVHLDDQHMHAGIALWATTVGLTSLEVFGQFGAEPPLDLRALFTLQVDALLDRIGVTAT